MSIKTVFLICVQALLIQSISGQCFGAYGPYDRFGYGGLGYAGYGYGGLGYDSFDYGAPLAAGVYGYGPASLAASNGPGLAVSSVSPLIPSGVSVLSENAYDGILAAGGAAPYLGTVAVEGALPTIGAGSIAYGCGDGAVAILAEDGYGYGLAGAGNGGYPLSYRPGYSFNYGAYGCNAFY